MPLNARTLGHDLGPDLVLLHGWGMNSAAWGPFLIPLAARCRLTLIDLPGHGASPFLDTAWAAACLEVAPPRADWLGWSLGAQVALAAAVAAPERVRRLLVVAGTPRFPAAPDWPGGMPAATFAQFETQLGQDHQATLERFLALQFLGDPQGRVAVRALRAQLLKHPQPSPAALAVGLALLRDLDLREDLRRLAVPSRWLFGARDTLIRPAIAAAVAALNPAAETRILADAAHAPFWTDPAGCVLSLFDLDHQNI